METFLNFLHESFVLLLTLKAAFSYSFPHFYWFLSQNNIDILRPLNIPLFIFILASSYIWGHVLPVTQFADKADREQ